MALWRVHFSPVVLENLSRIAMFLNMLSSIRSFTNTRDVTFILSAMNPALSLSNVWLGVLPN